MNPHKENFDILYEYLVSRILQEYSSKNRGDIFRYINKAKHRHVIGLLKACGYYNCGGKTGFIVRDMFDQYYSALPVNYNKLHHFSWTFYHLTCLPILEGDTIRITNYDHDKYFSISTWGKSGG